jgi:hypothetical protein
MGKKADLERAQAALAAEQRRSGALRSEIDRLQNLVIDLQRDKDPKET